MHVFVCSVSQQAQSHPVNNGCGVWVDTLVCATLPCNCPPYNEGEQAKKKLK